MQSFTRAGKCTIAEHLYPATGPALPRGKEQSRRMGSRLQVIEAPAIHGDTSGTQDGEQTSKKWPHVGDSDLKQL